MTKSYYSLGLMSGTSMDGVDVSIIQTDGKYKYKVIVDKYYQYTKSIYNNLTKLRDKIKNLQDLKKHKKQIKSVEKDITIFHGEAVNEILKKTKINIDFIGFHGQTIFHNAEEKISKQLGDGKLLTKLTKKKVIYDFRQNDLKNGGNGAPLTPIFHKLITRKKRIKLPVIFLNLGGIANVTYVKNNRLKDIFAYDIGPGNCLVDLWIRKKTKKKYDNKGAIARSGKIKEIILEAIHFTFNFIEGKHDKTGLPKRSLDVSDFMKTFEVMNFEKVSLKDGAATLTEFTYREIDQYLKNTKKSNEKIILCGGGRKNKFLLEKLKQKYKNVKLIDDYGINGDFVESQAFAYIAVRSHLKLPISFPDTTQCLKPSTGGVLVKNF